MKIISLNAWGGNLYTNLMRFIDEQRESTDIFAFQEMFMSDTPTVRTPKSGQQHVEGFRSDIFGSIAKHLKDDFNFYFAACNDMYDDLGSQVMKTTYGNGLFLKKDIEPVSLGRLFVFRDYNAVYIPPLTPHHNGEVPRNLQYVETNKYIIGHFHGAWFKNFGKQDNPSRIEQSQKIIDFYDQFPDKKKILVGDFNYDPYTESLAMLEENLVNLIKTHNVQTTRSRFYPKPEKYADYAMVSPDVQVNHFEVPYLEVSDHLPLILEFE